MRDPYVTPTWPLEAVTPKRGHGRGHGGKSAEGGVSFRFELLGQIRATAGHRGTRRPSVTPRCPLRVPSLINFFPRKKIFVYPVTPPQLKGES